MTNGSSNKTMTANELDLLVHKYLDHFDPYSLFPHLEMVREDHKLEILNQSTQGQSLYYQWLSCLVRAVNPKQVVELGSAAGISTIMMVTQLNKDAKLYSVDIDESIAWKWIARDYPQLIKILGDDLDMGIWPKEVDLKKTDVWFLDTLYTADQLQKEIDLYSKFWKKGAVVVLDDIRLPGLWKIWEKLPYDKYETTQPNHFSGFGHFIT